MAEEPQSGQEPQGQEPAVPETQSTETKTFDEGYVKELRREAAKNRKEAQEAQAKLSEIEERDKTDAEKALGKVESLTSDNARLKQENLRYQVGAEKDLPRELWDRLRGSSKEDLEADANALLKLVQSEPPSFDGGVREPAPESKSPEEGHRDLLLRAFGRTPNP